MTRTGFSNATMRYRLWQLVLLGTVTLFAVLEARFASTKKSRSFTALEDDMSFRAQHSGARNLLLVVALGHAVGAVAPIPLRAGAATLRSPGEDQRSNFPNASRG